MGPAALPRGLPVLGRRRRHGHRLGEGGGAATATPGSRRRGSTAWPCARSRPCSPAATRSTRRPAGTAPPTSTARPASPTRGPDFDMAEVYVPFSWYEPMWLENLGFCAEGDGWKLTEAGATAMIDGGDIPWNCSGGVLSSNPIGASGMLRFLEAALQVRGQAGEHQVDGARAGPRPGLRRRVAVLRHVGASAPTSPEATRARPICSAEPTHALTRRSSVKVVVDFDECASNAVCMGILPEVFEVRDDGYLYVLNENPPEEFREQAARGGQRLPDGRHLHREDD